MDNLKTKKISCRGRILRGLIRLSFNIPLLTKKNIIIKGSKYISYTKDRWKTPKGYTLNKYDFKNYNLEILKKDNANNDKLIFQLHGGGYLIDLIDIYRMTAIKYSKVSNDASIASIDYRLAEYKYPSALDDALDAWNNLLAMGFKEKNIIVAGDSAGGNLAFALVMKLRDQNRTLPKAIIAMSPWLDMAADGSSYEYNLYKDPVLGMIKNKKQVFKTGLNTFRIYAEDQDLYDKYLSPIYGDFTNFPNTLIQVGSSELIESDSISAYELLKEANVDVILSRYKNMFHDFQLLFSILPESKKAWKEIEYFINKNFYN